VCRVSFFTPHTPVFASTSMGQFHNEGARKVCPSISVFDFYIELMGQAVRKPAAQTLLAMSLPSRCGKDV
jgi:hypothetical protein